MGPALIIMQIMWGCAPQATKAEAAAANDLDSGSAAGGVTMLSPSSLGFRNDRACNKVLFFTHVFCFFAFACIIPIKPAQSPVGGAVPSSRRTRLPPPPPTSSAPSPSSWPPPAGRRHRERGATVSRRFFNGGFVLLH